MTTPVNIRITSYGPRIPGGVEQIRIEVTSLGGGPLMALEMNRGVLADSLAVDARQGVAFPCMLRSLEGRPAPQQAEPELVGRTVRI